MSARFAGPARAATFAALLALVASVMVLPILAPAAVQAMGPLPACRYDDLLTSPRQSGDWSVTLVDTILRIPKTYEPSDLVPVSRAGIPGKGLVRDLVIGDLRALSAAATAAHAAIGIVSAYRSYDRQKVVFDEWVADYGRPRALQVSARPGHSEHQLGLAIDFRSHPGGSPFGGDWATTAAGKWMKSHAWEFGFVMSYPKDKLGVVCYDYEPWHYRYVGRDVAAAIHASGLTLREYLWANHTTTIVPAGSPFPGTSPNPSAVASSSPVATESPGTSADLPTQEPSSATPPTAPSSEPAPSPTPVPSAPSAEGGAGAAPEAGIVASIAIAFGGIVTLGWMVLRRGRSGVGL